MFGTLRLNPSDNGPIFVERADGAVFSALGNNVPQHTACDQCRQKKLRCTGRKTGCDRCKANSIDCTYTQLYPGNGRRRERNKRSSQHYHSTSSSRSRSTSAPSQASPEQQSGEEPADSNKNKKNNKTNESIVVASAGNGKKNSKPSTALAPSPNNGVGGGDDSIGTGSSNSNVSSEAPSVAGQEIPISFLDENLFDGPSAGTDGWDGDFGIFDLDTAISPRAGFEAFTADSTNPSISGFNWSPYFTGPTVTCTCSPRNSTNHHHHHHHHQQSEDIQMPDFLPEGPVPASSYNSTATTCVDASHSAGDPKPNSTTLTTGCTNQCLQQMKALLEEVDTSVQDMGACQVDAALSYQKRACSQCSQIMRSCKTCYSDPDCMMFMIMICDKLIMITKKMLWYTMEAMEQHRKEIIGGPEVKKLQITKPIFAGEYEMDQLDEWAGMVQHLSGVQLRKIKGLVEDIEASPAISGTDGGGGEKGAKNSAQFVMLLSVKNSVVVLLGKIREALARAVEVGSQL